MRKIFIFFIDFYQRFLSIFSHGSCRYYPTCSSYAKWQIMHNRNIFLALFFSLTRLLRCNRLFVGGIDYPVVKGHFKKYPYIYFKKGVVKDIDFWFVPTKKSGYYFVIKHINFTQQIR